MFVIPVAKTGNSVMDPARRDNIPPEGRNVGTDHGDYWHRRTADGDIEIVAADKEKAAIENAARVEKARNEEADRAAQAAQQAEPAKTEAPKK